MQFFFLTSFRLQCFWLEVMAYQNQTTQNIDIDMYFMINCNPQMNSPCRAGSLLICYLEYDTVGLSGVIKGCGHELLSNRATNQLQAEPSYVQT